MVAAVVVVWIVLSVLVGLTMAPLRRPTNMAPLRRPAGTPLRRPSRMHPSSIDPGSLAAPPPGSVRR